MTDCKLRFGMLVAEKLGEVCGGAALMALRVTPDAGWVAWLRAWPVGERIYEHAGPAFHR